MPKSAHLIPIFDCSEFVLPNYQNYCEIFRDKPMPLAYVDLDLLQTNVQQIIQRAKGKPIRIASKSVRSVEVLRRIMDTNPAAFQGIMCYTAPEAIHLGEHGFKDLLVAYPTWDASHIGQVCEQIRAGKPITLMLDSIEHVQHLEKIAAQYDVKLPLCLDIDMSMDVPGLHFGVWRSSVVSVESALRVYEAIQQASHLLIEGVMGYEAQIAGIGDEGVHPKLEVIRRLKRRSIPVLRQRRQAIVEALQQKGATLRFVNGGGTGSIESTIEESVVTEVAAGSGFYSPALFDHYQSFKHLPAAGFAVQIVRQPKPHIFTCLGGGYIASGQVGVIKQPLPYLPVGAKLTSLEGAGEVQTPVLYRGSEKLKVGDPIFMRHSKAGELCEHFNTLYLISGGKIVDEVPTYRGEGKVFL